MAKGGQASNAQNAARASLDDSERPFYLHNGDHPGLNLVSHVLTGNNYNTWNCAMTIALIAKNKLGFVDGSFNRPAVDGLLYGPWLRCNSMVTSWILNSVNHEIADSLMYFATIREIWIDLRDSFQQSNAPCIFQLKKLLSALQQGSMYINTYYTRMRTIWDELKEFQPVLACQCGSMKDWINHHNQEFSIQFLMGLNDSYAQNRAQFSFIQLSNDNIQTISPVPLAMDLYSASAENFDTTCFFDFHDLREFPTSTQKPKTDLLVSGHAAQSESVNKLSLRLELES